MREWWGESALQTCPSRNPQEETRVPQLHRTIQLARTRIPCTNVGNRGLVELLDATGEAGALAHPGGHLLHVSEM